MCMQLPSICQFWCIAVRHSERRWPTVVPMILEAQLSPWLLMSWHLATCAHAACILSGKVASPAHKVGPLLLSLVDFNATHTPIWAAASAISPR